MNTRVGAALCGGGAPGCLNGAQAESAGGTDGVHTHSWSSEAARDPGADDDDCDDDAPNFDALLCLTADQDGG